MKICCQSKNSPQENLATPECDSIWSPVDLIKESTRYRELVFGEFSALGNLRNSPRPRIPRQQGFIVGESAGDQIQSSALEPG